MDENHPNQNKERLNEEGTIWHQFAGGAANIFPYFLIAYVASLLINRFYPLTGYINFTGFVIITLGLGLFSLFNHQSRAELLIVRNTWQDIYLTSSLFWTWVLHYPYRFLIGTTFVSLCLYLGANFLEITVAIFGAVSVLFLKNTKISGSLAILALVLTAGLSIFNQAIWAEQVAVFAFYFLVITVLTAMTELVFEK